jgi:hypothetical protein
MINARNMKMELFRRGIPLFLFCVAGGCSQQASENEGAPERIVTGPSFSRDIQPVFDSNCVACHQSQGASGNLNLESGSAYAALVSVKSDESPLPYVAPGNPDGSYLIRKIEGTHIQAGGSGERMPLTGPLDSASIAKLRDWVKSGASQD